MKILMTTDTVGGVWNYSLELIRQLEATGVEVALATMGAPLRPDQRAAAETFQHLELFESDYKLCWMADPWADVAAAGEWLQRLARELRPDLVHLNDYPHGSLAWSCPVLMVGHSCVLSWFEAVRGHAAGAAWDRYRTEVAEGLQHADVVIAPSGTMLDVLQRHYGPLPHRHVIFNGCSDPRFRAATKEPRVLSAGRLWDEGKNVATVARAAPAIRWPVAIAGENEHPDGGHLAVNEVEWLGRLDTDSLAHWYGRSAIYAHPARYEPFGLSVLEAALSGCALVLGDIASLREIWGDAAVYVPPDDDHALAAAINTLIDRDDQRTELAQRSRRRALELDAARMAEGYLRCYRSLTDHHALALTAVPPCDS